MEWEIEFTDEFEQWWNGLTEDEQIAVAAKVRLLEERGPSLPYPHSSDIRGSKYTHLRELIIQCHGEPFRVLYAFDPRRIAILLLGGNKTGYGGHAGWYELHVPIAEEIYGRHLADIEKEAKQKDAKKVKQKE